MKYSTSDLNTASFLRAKGLSITAYKREGNRISFEFDSEKSEKMALDYLNGASVKANVFAQVLQELKTLIFSKSI